MLCGPNHRSQTLCWPVPTRPWPARIHARLDPCPRYARHLLRQLVRGHTAQRELALKAMGGRRKLQALKAPHRGRGRNSDRRIGQDVETGIARHYWRWLIGPGFRRDSARPDPNAVVHFVHAALRIETVRAIHAAGCWPAPVPGILSVGADSRTT